MIKFSPLRLLNEIIAKENYSATTSWVNCNKFVTSQSDAKKKTPSHLAHGKLNVTRIIAALLGKRTYITHQLKIIYYFLRGKNISFPERPVRASANDFGCEKNKVRRENVTCLPKIAFVFDKPSVVVRFYVIVTDSSQTHRRRPWPSPIPRLTSRVGDIMQMHTVDEAAQHW